MVLRVSLSLVGCHGWHSETSRQWYLQISAVKGEVDVDGAASVFLAPNFLSLAPSSFISSFIRETIGRSSLLLEVVESRLASKWVYMCSPLLRPSWSNTLHDGLRASYVGSFSHDFATVLGLVERPEAIIF